MAKEIIMPKFGFTQEESEILEWLKNDGDKVEKGDPIAVVSTDKISMEVESPESGILDGIRYKVGDIVPVTKIIAYVLQPGEKLPEGDVEASAVANEPKQAVAEAEKPASAVEKTGSFSISPVAQRLADDKQVDLNNVRGSGKDGQITRKDVEDYLAEVEKTGGKIRATPAARRLAQEKKIDLQQARGSGPGGRIQSTDVPSVKQPAAAVASQPIPAGLKVLKEIPMIGMRRAIAQNMQRSWQEAPQIIFQLDIEMDAAEGLRKLANENKIEGTPKISVTALLIKAAALTIKQNPIVNSQYTSEKVIVFEDINIGMAAAVENGLIVPVIRNVEKKGLVAISREVNDLAKRVREGKIMPDDLANGTFTISNLGMYGIDRFTAIVNPPQAAILAVGKMNRVFLPDADNQPALHNVMNFSLSVDHRVMDGSQAAKFLTDMKNNLMNVGELLK